MHTAVRSGSVICLALLMGLLSACSEKAGQGPSTEEFAKEREALQARIARKQGPPDGMGQARSGGKSAAPAQFGAVGHDYRYDASGKRDPFRNFKWTRPDRLAMAEITTPLEQYDLGQLSLVAVVWKTGNARALIHDPAGASYIVGEGARIGKNAGLVKLIRDGLVVVTETYVDYLGQETLKDVEMRMRRNEGG